MKNHQKKSKRKWPWILLILVLVLLLAVAAVALAVAHYRKGFEEAFTYSEQYTQDELKQKHKDLNYDVHDTLKEVLPEANMDILNERDRRKLSEGELNPEQTAEIFREARKRAGLPEREEPTIDSSGDNIAAPSASLAPTPVASGAPTASASPKPSPVASKTPTASASPKPSPVASKAPTASASPKPSPGASKAPTVSASPKPVAHRSVDVIIEDFYILKSRYITNLDALIRRCKVEWRAKPKSEQTFSARLAMANKCIRLGNALEAECDAEMASLVAELKAALLASGQSTSIVSQIQAVYDQEKQLKKAALIDRYYPS